MTLALIGFILYMVSAVSSNVVGRKLFIDSGKSEVARGVEDGPLFFWSVLPGVNTFAAIWFTYSHLTDREFDIKAKQLYEYSRDNRVENLNKMIESLRNERVKELEKSLGIDDLDAKIKQLAS